MLFLNKMQVLGEERTSYASLRRWSRHRSGPRNYGIKWRRTG